MSMFDALFPADELLTEPTLEDWRRLAALELRGAPLETLDTPTYERIVLRPLYVPGRASAAQHERASGAWELRTEHAPTNAAEVNRHIREDLAGGAAAVCIKLGAQTCADGAPAHKLALAADDLDALLDGVDVCITTVALEGGVAFAGAAALLAAVWRRRRIAGHMVRGSLGADPLGSWSRAGRLPSSAKRSLEILGELAAWANDNYPQVRAVGVDVSPYHNAGASADQELAFALATGVEYLRAMTSAGLSVESAARQIEFRFCSGEQFFLSLSMLRAARQLWASVLRACGLDGAPAPMRIHATVSQRLFARRHMEANLVRNTSAVFAAAVGGADSITPMPHDAPRATADSLSRRLARNSMLIADREARLRQDIDPAAGSWFLDEYRDQLCQRAWDIFQDIERQGGMAAAIESGTVAALVETSFEKRAADIASGRTVLTGVTIYPVEEDQTPAGSPHGPPPSISIACVSEQSPSSPAIETPVSSFESAVAAAEAGRTLAQIQDRLFGGPPSPPAPRLPFRSLAALYEAAATKNRSSDA